MPPIELRIELLSFPTLPYLAALAGLALGCGSSTSLGSGDSGAAVSADQACGDQAHALCTKMQTCTPADVQATYGTELQCESRVKSACLDAHAAPSTGNTPERTESCAQAYPAYACGDYRNRTNIPPSCQFTTGSLAAGAACEYAAQCQTGFCAIVPGNACGQCATMPQMGDSCAQLTSCGQTLTCTTDTLVCATLAGSSQACGAGQPCGPGLSCVAPGGAGTAGTCQTAGAQVGAACDGSAKTAATCDGALGLYCDGLTKQCAQATYAGASQPCGYDVAAGTFVGCTAGACVGALPAQGQLGTCSERAADEGACTVSDGGASTPSAGCLPSARCIAADGGAGTCQAVSAATCH